MTNDGNEREVIIIGGGTAGFAAGIYTSRAMLNPLLFTGNTLGGQLSLTLELENYPGFFGTEAFGFIEGLKEQAERFGTDVVMDTVTDVEFDSRPFVIKTYEETYTARSVVVCTGSSPRLLSVPGEKEFGGRGVSYCATCDGFFFKDKRIVVVGGGDAAMEEAVFLTKFASEVHVVHRRDKLRAGPILQKLAFDNEKIRFIWDTVVTEICGNDQKTTGVRLKNVKSNQISDFEIDGVFIFIGHIPNTDIFRGKLDMDDQGYVLVDRHQSTNIQGVFAAGDVHDSIYRQAITAAGAGAAAGISVRKYLEEDAATRQS